MGEPAARRDRPGCRPRRAGDLDGPAGPFTELAAAIPGPDGPWGVLLLVADGGDGLGSTDLDLAAVLADAIGTIVSVAHREEEVGHLLHRAEALRRVAGDIGSRLDLDRILTGLVDHAMVLFEADRAAVFMRRPDGTDVAEVSRNLSAGYLNAMRAVQVRSSRPPRPSRPADRCSPSNYRDDPRGADVRAAVVQEGYDTLCTAPLMDGTELLGPLNVYHDTPHAVDRGRARDHRLARDPGQRRHPDRPELPADGHLDSAAAVDPAARRAAEPPHERARHRPRDRHASCASSSISTTSASTGSQGTDLVPVAMQGQVGEYVDETPDQLRVAVGEGITGWVAENRVGPVPARCRQGPPGEHDPGHRGRPRRIDAPRADALRGPGARRAGPLQARLHQFSDDDLRLLVIYASFAAQAMVNADTTQRLREQSMTLERQLRSQRELLQITETILTTLDGRAVLEGITDRLGTLIACDNVAIEVVDPSTGRLTPLTARGVHAARYLEPWEPGETGVATWVVEHNEPVYIEDETDDPRVNQFRDEEPRGRQPDRRPAARTVGRHRGPDHRAVGRRQHLHGRGVRPRQAVRGAGVDRAPERRGLPGRRDPRPDRRPDRAAQPRHVRGLPRHVRPRRTRRSA